MKSLTYKGFAGIEFADTPSNNNNTYNISSSGSYDPETYTISDATVDLTTVFTAGGIVMNACYNDVYANIVSVTANDVVLDGDLRGYYDNAGTIGWYQPILISWPTATAAFQVTAPTGEGAALFGNYNEFTKQYPGNSSWTAPLRSSKLVSYDGDVATLDWPCAVLNTTPDSVVSCGNGTNMHIDIDSCYAMSFWMGDGYYMDLGVNTGSNYGYYEFHDGYGLSNGNQTEEQLYERYDEILQKWSRMLDSNYTENSAPMGEGVFGSYFFK